MGSSKWRWVPDVPGGFFRCISPKNIFVGRKVKLLTGGWKTLGKAIKNSEKLTQIGNLKKAPAVEQVASAVRYADIVWDCGLEDDGETPTHLGYAEQNVAITFAKWDEIKQHLATVHQMFRDTDSDVPIHILFLSGSGMVRSVATACIVKLVFQDLSGKAQASYSGCFLLCYYSASLRRPANLSLLPCYLPALFINLPCREERQNSSRAENNQSTKLAPGDRHAGGDGAHLPMVSATCLPHWNGVRQVRQE